MLGWGWMGIERLTVGDPLATRAGPALVVQSITKQHRAEGYLVYNLTVEGDHTYFVGKAKGGGSGRITFYVPQLVLLTKL